MATIAQTRQRTTVHRRGEARLPAVVAVLVAVSLYAILPSRLLAGPRYVVPVLEIVLLIPLLAINPLRMTRETRLSRALSIALVIVIAAANLVTLGLLVDALVASKLSEGKRILLAAFEVWLTNIVVFALAYWELDRGGPVKRAHASRDELPPADFRFSQDENDDAVQEVARGSSIRSGWVPGFVDYLYVSITNSTAFSPTDTMPLSVRAKLLMSVQAIAAFLTSILVISRAVGVLK
jgi:hypothetical protein